MQGGGGGSGQDPETASLTPAALLTPETPTNALQAPHGPAALSGHTHASQAGCPGLTLPQGAQPGTNPSGGYEAGGGRGASRPSLRGRQSPGESSSQPGARPQLCQEDSGRVATCRPRRPGPPRPEGGSQCKSRRREGDVDRLQGESQACDRSFLTSSPPAGEGGHVPQKGSRVCPEGRGQQGGRQPASRLWGVTATCRGLAGSQAVHLERLEDEPCPLPRMAQPSFLPPRVLHVPERREPSLWGLGAEEGREASFALDLDPEGQGREAVTERNGRPCRDGPQGHAWLEGCVPRRRTSSSRPRSVDTHTHTAPHGCHGGQAEGPAQRTFQQVSLLRASGRGTPCCLGRSPAQAGLARAQPREAGIVSGGEGGR